MKKLYLFAALAMVAFTGYAGIDALMNKDIKFSLFEKTELTKPLDNKDLAVAKAKAEKLALEQKDAQKKAEKKSQAANEQLQSLLKGQATGLQCSTRDALDFSALKGASDKKKGALYAPTINEYGIMTAPGEGTTKYYKRSGGGYYVQSQKIYLYDQSSLDLLETVEAEDGTVYFKNLVGKYTTTSYPTVWVK